MSEILPQAAILLFQEVLGKHTEENARLLHPREWQKWYQPEARVISQTLLKDAQKTQLLIAAIQRALQTQPLYSSNAKPVTDREYSALRLRFGLEDGVVRSHTTVGRELGVSRNRATQLEQAAVRKISQPLVRTFLQTAAFIHPQ